MAYSYDFKDNVVYGADHINAIRASFLTKGVVEESATSCMAVMDGAEVKILAGQAIFEDGYVFLENGEVIENGEKVDLDTADNNDVNTGININTADGYGDEILYFIDCVENDKEIERVTPESSLESIKLVEETLKACKKI